MGGLKGMAPALLTSHISSIDNQGYQQNGKGSIMANKPAVETTTAKETSKAASSMVVVDIGKQSRRKIRRLRKGQGSLMEDVAEIVDGLSAEGKIAANAQPVVIVVREKRRNRKRWMFPI